MSTLLYLDSSALVKLGKAEAETGTLQGRIAACDIVTSEIAEVELRRALHAVPDTEVADTILRGVLLQALDPQLRRVAVGRCRRARAPHLPRAASAAPLCRCCPWLR